VDRQFSKDKSWLPEYLACLGVGKPEYLASLGEGFKLTPSRLTGEALKAPTATDFVQPEVVTGDGDS
jgi:hypothetical protein